MVWLLSCSSCCRFPGVDSCRRRLRCQRCFLVRRWATYRKDIAIVRQIEMPSMDGGGGGGRKRQGFSWTMPAKAQHRATENELTRPRPRVMFQRIKAVSNRGWSRWELGRGTMGNLWVCMCVICLGNVNDDDVAEGEGTRQTEIAHFALYYAWLIWNLISVLVYSAIKFFVWILILYTIQLQRDSFWRIHFDDIFICIILRFIWHDHWKSKPLCMLYWNFCFTLLIDIPTG